MTEMGLAYAEVFCFSNYLKVIESVKDAGTKEVLEQLARIYAYTKISDNAVHYRTNDFLSSD